MPCGSISSDTEVVLEAWRKNFKDLLNPVSEHTHSHLQTEETLNSTNDDQLNGNISTEEIKAALRRLHDKKAEGIDEIPAQILRNQTYFRL